MGEKYISAELKLETYGKVNPVVRFLRNVYHRKTGYVTIGIPLVKDDWETG